MNKRGVGESLMFFVFILIMIIVSVGIVSGLFIFFGQGYDFREAEAEILANKFISCLDSNSERLNEEFDIISDCGFTENIRENHLVYAKRLNDGKVFFEGVISYREECFFDASEKNRNLPRCVKGEVSIGGESFEVIIGSSQNSRRLIA